MTLETWMGYSMRMNKVTSDVTFVVTLVLVLKITPGMKYLR